MEEEENIMHICSCCSDKLHQDFQKQFDKNIIKIGDFIKTKFTEKGKSEHMWVKVLEIGEDNIKGNLANEPNTIKKLKVWDFVKIKFEDIENYERGKR